MTFGLIAGNGNFPFLVIEGAKRVSQRVVVVAIKEETDPRIEEVADKVLWIGIGQLGKMIKFFKSEGALSRATCRPCKPHFDLADCRRQGVVDHDQVIICVERKFVRIEWPFGL